MTTAIKIILALLFFVCLAVLPYGYYQFVRFVGFIGFGILGYQAYEQRRESWAIVYASLAILFQPFIKIALGRPLWNIIDVVVGVGLLLSIALEKNK